jgi:hypothetical protein
LLHPSASTFGQAASPCLEQQSEKTELFGELTLVRREWAVAAYTVSPELTATLTINAVFARHTSTLGIIGFSPDLVDRLARTGRIITPTVAIANFCIQYLRPNTQSR